MDVQLEALVQRYEAGERDPELIRLLNELAWKGFHDPWEPDPGKRPPEEETMDDDAIDPKTVYPVSLATLERFLEKRELHGWKAPGNGYLVQFRYDADSDREVHLYLGLEGPQFSLLKVRLTCDRRVDRARFQEAFRFCNDWNAAYRWPNAFVECPESGDGGEESEPAPVGSGSLVLESHFDLSAGIHQALFDDLVHTSVAASWDFWNQARDYGF
jgi:hypothetical protein